MKCVQRWRGEAGWAVPGTEATEEEVGTTLGVGTAKVPGSTSHFSTQ